MSFLPTLYPTFGNARCNKQKLTLCTVWPYRFLLLFWIQNDNNKKKTKRQWMNPFQEIFILFPFLSWFGCNVWCDTITLLDQCFFLSLSLSFQMIMSLFTSIISFVVDVWWWWWWWNKIDLIMLLSSSFISWQLTIPFGEKWKHQKESKNEKNLHSDCSIFVF